MPKTKNTFSSITTIKALLMLSIVICSLLIVNCFAQSITWQRLYDGPGNNSDGAFSICKADSNNFYLDGYTFIDATYRRIYIIKINSYGDTIWTRIIGNNSQDGPRGLASVSSGDGGCVITGDWDSAYTIKINKFGNIIWLKKYVGGTSPQLLDLKKTNDGGYIACGRERTNNFNGYILKIDSLGNLQWFRIYPSTYFKEFSSIEIEDFDKYILVGGSTTSSLDTSKGLIIKIDTVGNIIWEKKYIVNGPTAAYKIAKTPNGYIIGGDSYPWLNLDSMRAYYREIDTAGNEIYTKIFASNRKEIFGTLGIFNNYYVIASSVDSFPPPILTGRIRITDTNGNVLRERKVFTPDYIVFSSLVTLLNGDIIFAGEADFSASSSNDFYALRTDSLLTISPLYGIKKLNNSIPVNFKLYQNYPNPFNPKTNIKFDVAFKTHVKIVFYNVLGQKVDEAVNDIFEPGSYLFEWRNDKLSSGVYFCQLITDNLTQTKKIIVLK